MLSRAVFMRAMSGQRRRPPRPPPPQLRGTVWTSWLLPNSQPRSSLNSIQAYELPTERTRGETALLGTLLNAAATRASGILVWVSPHRELMDAPRPQACGACLADGTGSLGGAHPLPVQRSCGWDPDLGHGRHYSSGSQPLAALHST